MFARQSTSRIQPLASQRFSPAAEGAAWLEAVLTMACFAPAPSRLLFEPIVLDHQQVTDSERPQPRRLRRRVQPQGGRIKGRELNPHDMFRFIELDVSVHEGVSWT